MSQQVTIHCAGTGDAFGSGGRLNSCYHFSVADKRFLVDCGSSALIGLQRYGLPAKDIDAIFISHLHGDHFGGIPYILLEGCFASKRKSPLLLVGPAGLQERVEAACEALYRGTLSDGYGFPVNYLTLDPQHPLSYGPLRVSCFPVNHGSSLAYGLKISTGEKTISYTGDSEWTENLVTLAKGSDLLIAECVAYQHPVPSHLDFLTLQKNRERLDCKRLVLTHLGPEMLERINSLKMEVLQDGQTLEL